MKMTKTRVIKIRPQNPDLDVLAEAAAVLRSAKVIGFPTETVYGIGALYRFPEAVERVYEIKGRDRNKPLTFHIANFSFLNRMKFKNERVFRYLARKFWPGPLTLIIADESGKTFGFRMPNHPVARVLIELCGDPLLATSANLSGNTSPVTPDQVLAELDGKIELLIDSGKCALEKESTIVDLVETPFKIVREGAQVHEIKKVLDEVNAGKLPKFRVLFVCTGNTCRSPMAEAWLKHQIKKDQIDNKIEVDSCGVFAYKNMPATQEVTLVLKEDGIDASRHLAKPLSLELAKEADQIYAMTSEHERFILQGFPYFSGKVKVLDIMDPIGMELSVYRSCYKEIKEKMAEELKWLKERCS